MFKRESTYFHNRFHKKQILAYLAYKSGKHLVLDWGRRSGKTHLGVEMLIEDVETYGKDVVYIAPTQQSAREIVLGTIKKSVGGRRDWKYVITTSTFVHIPSGATLYLKGADRGFDNLRGGAKRMIICDEYAFWSYPDELMKEVLIPQLADYNGQLIVFSTPKGFNHLWKLKQEAIETPEEYYTLKCTMFENNFMNPKGIERMKKMYDGEDDPLYKQEILAEYVDFKGLVYSIDWKTVICDWQPYEYDQAEYHLGIDLGFNDPTACVVLAYNPQRDQYCIYSYYQKSATLLEGHIEIIGALSPYPIESATCDNHLQSIAEINNILQKKGKMWSVQAVRKSSNAQSKEGELLSLVSAFRYGKLTIAPQANKIISELATYEWGQEKNDHVQDALRYSWVGHVLRNPMGKNARVNIRKSPVELVGDYDGQVDL